MAYSRERTSKTMEGDKFLFVAAIDFGTTFSGYAFASLGAESAINMNKNWSGGSFESYKTPTSVLFGPEGFQSFGYDAELSYSTEPTDSHELYRHFKMLLYDETITKSVEISATNGKRRAALEVFAEALKYLKNHMIAAINKTIESEVEGHMIRWVITLPAIWRDGAKQFMREAALEAGLIEVLYSRQLVLALEPEVASIYCRDMPVHLAVETSACQFELDSEYLIVDAGGGTVDITAHRVLPDGYVREILQPCGGPWGGLQVDKAFEKLIRETLGDNVVDHLKGNKPNAWLKLVHSFEVLKKGVSAEKPESKISIDMSYQICKEIDHVTGRPIDESLTKENNKHVYFENGRLTIDHTTSLGLFTPTTEKIADYVCDLLEKPELENVTFVLLVGGFGGCSILQSALKEKLPSTVTLIVPNEAQLAIVKGAVKFGLNSKLVESRFARKTYGIDIEPRFRPGTHKLSKTVIRDKINYCGDVFLEFIRKGTPVLNDEVSQRTLRARTETQPSMTFDIYCCDTVDLSEVEYVTDNKFTRVGGLTVLMPNTQGGRNREVEVKFQFGGTEIRVSAEDKASGEIATTEVDMLLP